MCWQDCFPLRPLSLEACRCLSLLSRKTAKKGGSDCLLRKGFCLFVFNERFAYADK